jgi:hypothetical protein
MTSSRFTGRHQRICVSVDGCGARRRRSATGAMLKSIKRAVTRTPLEERITMAVFARDAAKLRALLAKSAASDLGALPGGSSVCV